MADIVICSGYFDPIHIGHLELFEKAKLLGDKLYVIVNNDKQTKIKKGRSFMNEKERVKIVSSLKGVDKVILSFDEDKSVCETLKELKYLHSNDKLIFANGGDTEGSREKKVCEELGIIMVNNLGDKIQSSSSLTGIKSK